MVKIHVIDLKWSLRLLRAARDPRLRMDPEPNSSTLLVLSAKILERAHDFFPKGGKHRHRRTDQRPNHLAAALILMETIRVTCRIPLLAFRPH
jgi:hypothetical protein